MRYFKNLVRPYIVWSAILIVIPLFMILLYAFTKTGNSLLNIQFTLENFVKFADEVYVEVFIKSLKLGILTVLICLVLGYALAYVICLFSEKVQNVLILLVTIPMWINMLLRTYAWMSILSENGLVNMFLQKLGIEPLNMMYTDFSVMIGMICNFLPFMIIPIHTSLSKMDKSLTEASYDLGANKLQTFRRVVFPQSIPGVINGVIMVFLLAISSFVIPKLLGGGQYVLIGNLIENQFISIGDWNLGSAISLILAIIIIAAVSFMKKLDRDEGQVRNEKDK
jgi:spermidine/putrescine transport system permease protein